MVGVYGGTVVGTDWVLGGVYFSTLSPVSYGLGTPKYEDNIIRGEDNLASSSRGLRVL